MLAWWSDLSGANQAFYVMASFFSAIFLWQFISALIDLPEFLGRIAGQGEAKEASESTSDNPTPAASSATEELPPWPPDEAE